MSDPGLLLQGAVNAALRADATVQNYVSNRIYDSIAQSVAFPYITLGAVETHDDKIEDFDSLGLTITIHVWSRNAGKVEAQQIADAVKAACHNKTLPLDFNWRMSTPLRRDRADVLIDPDGRTTHVALTYHCLADPLTP